MPLCLLCPTGDQPSFVDVRELKNHVSEVHSNVPRNPANHPPRQLVSATQCCICNKKFASPGALSAHQRAKQHYPSRSASPRKSASPEEPARKSDAPGGSPPPFSAANGNTTVDQLNLAQQGVIQRCHECQANFASLAEFERHNCSHGKIPCSKCSYLSSTLFEWNEHFKQAHQRPQPSMLSSSICQVESVPDASPAITRPASSQSMSNKSVFSTAHGKGAHVCDLCGKAFKGQAGLQAHAAAKHPPMGAECVICHAICPSTAALREHIDTIHSCAVCQDGILRDTRTLSDHMLEHTHPILCKRCGTRYQTEGERNLHFTAAVNDHPVCLACHLGFENDGALRAHTNSVHAASPSPSAGSKPTSSRLSAGSGVEDATPKPRVFECDVCHEACLSQTELDVHIVTVHSCPICHDGIYMDMRELEEHLEQHRSSYACHSCGLTYTEEGQLLEHYKDSSSDIHPRCEQCHLGFENYETYAAHFAEVHPRVACDVCDGECYGLEELAVHYLNSPKHPKCDKCGIGFRDRFDYTDHGASAHPDCHCYLCQWHFDSPNVLQNHINHFFNHPKCQDCNVRFPDTDTYQYHLFSAHRPSFDDQGHSDASEVRPAPEDKTLRDDHSSPLQSPRAFDPVWGFEGSAGLPYASYIPLPPSLSGYSSPTSQRVTREFSGSMGSRSRSSTLSVEQHSPTDGQSWNVTVQSPSPDYGQGLKASPKLDHSPLSTVPAVGTPLMSSVPTIRSVDIHSPFSPRPEQPPLFSLSQGISDAVVTAAEQDGANSDASSSFTRSPPLISPVVKLPDPGGVSPTSTSSWTMTSDTDSRRSAPHPHSTYSANGIDGTFSLPQTASSEHTVPQLSLLVPSSTQAGSANNSGYPSSISPESAGISVSASMTPEFLREARAYLSLTHREQEPSSPPDQCSPCVTSPVLSSTGLAMGERGRRREVRFEENILTETAWDRHSESSDSSLDPPVIHPRPGSGILRMNGISKLPRFSALRRPTRKWTNGQANHVSPHLHNRRSNEGTPSSSYHCRSCYRDHCEEPTTTTCGHLFCYECISTAIIKDPHCPICAAPTLLYCLFRIDTSA